MVLRRILGLSALILGAGGFAACSTATAEQSCGDGTTVFVAESASSNVMFLLDRSGSMHLPINEGQTRWSATKGALFTMFDSLEDRAHGSLTLFPAGDAPLTCCPVSDPNCGACSEADIPAPGARCDSGSYNEGDFRLMNDTTIQILKDQVSESDKDHYWGTPLTAALDGSLSALTKQVDGMSPTSLVLLTDGKPTACDTADDPAANDINLTVDVVRAAAEMGIQTYVVGVIDGETAADASDLSKLAVAGGTARFEGCEEADECAYAVRVESFEKDAAAALAEIAANTVSCTFETKDLSAYAAPVVSIIAGHQRHSVVHDPTHADGWDHTDLGGIRLYGKSCEVFKADATAQVKVTVACEERAAALR
jgi:hypothetical protein